MVCTPTKPATVKSTPVINYKNIKEKYLTRPCKLSMKLKELAISNDMSESDVHSRQMEAKKNINRLRNCMPEKLTAFCKMHLSSILELDGSKLEYMFVEPEVTKKKPITPFASSNNKERPSSAAVSQESVNQMYKLVNYLKKSDHLKTEGLFRKTGNISRQRLLKDQIVQGLDLNFQEKTFSAHDIATVLKQMLSDLPEPLLTKKRFEAYLHIDGMVRENQTDKERLRAQKKQLKALQLMTLLLPRENISLLEGLLRLLHQVANITENKMSASSLGIVFAPSLLCPRTMSPEELHMESARVGKTIATMIENAPQLFMIPQELSDDVVNFWKEMENPNMVELAKKNRAGSIQNSAKRDKRNFSSFLEESLKKHFPMLTKAKQQDLFNSEEPEVDWSVNKSISIDNIFSYTKTPDNKYTPLLRHNSAVHIVDLGTCPYNVKPKKRLHDDNIETYAVKDTLPSDLLTKSVKKLQVSSNKDMMTTGSRMPMLIFNSSHMTFMESVL